jgi:hypothetical protein
MDVRPAGAARLCVLGVVAGSVGCGPDLAQLETEQQALEQEVVVLRRTVEEMRTQMQAMGLMPSGPAAASSEVGGGEDLSNAIRVTAERQGEIPTFPVFPEAERRDSTPCGYRFYVPWLESISDQVLEQTGSGRASPILLLHDGKALTPHAGPLAYEKSCKFSFRHQPRYLFFSPANAVENIGGEWTMKLATDVPLARGDDRAMYWVYPGTTLSFTFSRGWDSDAWGEMKVSLDARLLYVGTPEAPTPRPSSPATASFLGAEESSDDPRLGFEHVPEAPDGPWTLDITSPSDGPYVLVETLVIGNDQHSLVVSAATGEAAPEGDP